MFVSITSANIPAGGATSPVATSYFAVRDRALLSNVDTPYWSITNAIRSKISRSGVDFFVNMTTLIVIVSILAAAHDVGRLPLLHTDLRSLRSTAVTMPSGLRPIHNFAPFGRIAESDGSSEGALQLRGTIVGKPAAASIALIALSNEPTRVFSIGAILPGGRTIVSIELDGVRLQGGKQKSFLRLVSRFGHDHTAKVASQAINPPIQVYDFAANNIDNAPINSITGLAREPDDPIIIS